MKLLEGLAESMTESITLKMPLDRISGDMIHALDQLCATHTGKHRLRMEIIDPVQRMKVPMIAKERMVHADNDFIRELERLGLDFYLNAS